MAGPVTNSDGPPETPENAEPDRRLGAPGSARPGDRAHDTATPAAGTQLLWLALSASPAVLLVAVTSHLTQEVAAVPLLWTLPLALYLLSFVLCFGHESLATRAVWAPALAGAAALALFGLHRVLELDVPERVLLWCAVLFVYAMACHGELVRRRPEALQLTRFYLVVSAGGVVGGGFCALVAPRLFDGYWELHVGLFAGALAVAVSWAADPRSRLHADVDGPAGVRLAIAAGGLLVVLAVVLALDVDAEREGLVLSRRGFYGVLRVSREWPFEPEEQLKLLHGRIAHGVQVVAPDKRRQPTTYFGPSSGVGLSIARHPRRLAGQPLRVAVVGLGVGTLAAWSRAGDVFRFYELDPEVVRLSAGEAPLFTYLREAAGRTSVTVGDGRLSLEREAPLQLDLLVLDAFSSDAVPAHLLTREAFAVYERHLRLHGVIAVNVTNRYLDLKPVVRGVAADRGFAVAHVPSYERGVLWSSDWMVLSRDVAFFADEVVSAATLPPVTRTVPVLWTDEWSELSSIMKR